MTKDQMLVRDAGIREQNFARELLRHLPVGVTYEDVLTHGVYDASRDTISLTVKGIVFSRKVTSP